MRFISPLALLLCTASAARAQVVAFNNVNKDIPDDSIVGVGDSQTVSLPSNLPIGALTVTVAIDPTDAGMFNGDIYLTLAKQGTAGFTVLLNRAGVTASNPYGYSDNGFSVTFDDTAAFDIHSYRIPITGSDSIPLSSNPLTGTWQPDGRNTDPNTVLDTDPRTAMLSAFQGITPNGQWTIYAADLSGGGTAKLTSWSMDFTLVPEPKAALFAVGIVLCGFGCLCRWRRA